MSHRALGSFLTRRFAPSGAQAESSFGIGINKAPESAAGRLAARSLHTPRHLAVGDGSSRARSAAAAALAGFVALLYFNRDTNKSAGEVTGVEATKEVPHVVVKEGDLTGREDAGLEEDLEVDEEAMQSRFEEWMAGHTRVRRRRLGDTKSSRRGKLARIGITSAMPRSRPNASHFGTTAFSDWTDEEWSRTCCGSDVEAIDWEYSKAMIAEGRLVTAEDTEEDVLARLMSAKNTKDVSDKAINN